MYKDDMSEELRNTRNDFIQIRWAQPYSLSKDSTDDAIKYLFTVNVAGSVATLAYLGTISNSGITNTFWMNVSLTLFFVGLILVGILKAYTLKRMEGIFKHYREEVDQYYDNNISLHELNKSDGDKVCEPQTQYVLGWLSFGCFIVGSIIGACNL